MKTLLVREDGRVWRLSAHSRLQGKVLRMASREDDPLAALRGVAERGCSSGIIGDMVYYDDTVDFFLDHRGDITRLVAARMKKTGLGMSGLFDGWEEDDPFALHAPNRNLLAWFGFEESARALLESKELVGGREDGGGGGVG